jgi:glutamate transport system permease protein
VHAITDNLGLYWSGLQKSFIICMLALVGSLALGTLLAGTHVALVRYRLRNGLP